MTASEEPTPSRTSRRTAAAFAATAATLALGAATVIALDSSWLEERYLLATRGTGWVALGALVLALASSPVARLARRVSPHAARVPWGALRRAFGITSALSAFLHAITSLATGTTPGWPTLITWPHLRMALVALAILAALLLTSFDVVLRTLRVRAWKSLHRASWVGGAFVLLHVLMSPFASRTIALAIFAALVAIRLLALIVGKRRRAESNAATSDP